MICIYFPYKFCKHYFKIFQLKSIFWKLRKRIGYKGISKISLKNKDNWCLCSLYSLSIISFNKMVFLSLLILGQKITVRMMPEVVYTLHYFDIKNSCVLYIQSTNTLPTIWMSSTRGNKLVDLEDAKNRINTYTDTDTNTKIWSIK